MKNKPTMSHAFPHFLVLWKTHRPNLSDDQERFIENNNKKMSTILGTVEIFLFFQDTDSKLYIAESNYRNIMLIWQSSVGWKNTQKIFTEY